MTTHFSFISRRIKSYFSISMGSSSKPMSSSPLSICSFTRSAVAVKMSKLTRGYFSRKVLNNSGSNCTEAISPQPMEIFPSTCSSCSANSFSVLSTSCRISSARLRSKIPSLVRLILREPLSNNLTPISSSIWDSCRLKVGCVICRTSDAFVILSSRTTVRK